MRKAIAAASGLNTSSPSGMAKELPNRPSSRNTGFELLALLGEFVDLYPAWPGRDGAPDEATGFELPQPLRQHVGGDAAEPTHQVRIALRAQHQFAYHEQGPTVTDEVEGPRDAARIAVCAPTHWLIVHSKLPLGKT